MAAPGLVPPTCYGMVEGDLHRSGQPNAMNLRFLEQLGLKMVIYLSADDPDLAFATYLEDQGVELRHLGAYEATRAPNSTRITEDSVLEALKLILDESNYPLIVMDHQGIHRTGTVIGCLRKAQRWCLTSIFDEYRRYAGGKMRPANEQFIELFDTDLVDVPPNPPSWFNK